jgi:hypothetical protein
MSQYKKYNYRDKTGKFAKLTSAKEGSCLCGKNQCGTTTIVAGRLYNWKGVTVRAFGQVGNQRLVMAHKTLSGLVADSELRAISKEEVTAYLAKTKS